MQLSETGQRIWKSKYASYPGEEFHQGCLRVSKFLGEDFLSFNQKVEMYKQLNNLKFSVGGRVWYASGKPKPYLNNCALFKVEDSKEEWAKTLHDIMLSLTCGMGVGTEVSAVRGKGEYIAGLGGTASGTLSYVSMVNEVARHIMQGNTRRAACHSAIHWKHKDLKDWLSAKIWSEDYQRLKEKDWLNPAPFDIHNLSIRYDQEFLEAYFDETHTDYQLARDVFNAHMRVMFEHGDPNIQFDADGQILRNACCEIISNVSGDSCTLASINLAMIDSLDEMIQATEYAVVATLLARHKSLYPTQEMKQIAHSNMRLGVGFFGLHNWLLKRGYRYEWNEELSVWMREFALSSRYFADYYAEKFGFERPVAVTSTAPTGSISKLFSTETVVPSSGIEPIFASAYELKMQDGDTRVTTTVIDPNVLNLVQEGLISPYDDIEDAYSLASVEGFKKRIEMQSMVQKYMDNAISSTVNLPEWGSSQNNEQTLEEYKEIILAYLPHLRGLTVYPDGARTGQPLTKIALSDALAHKGVVVDSAVSSCSTGLCEL